MAQPTNVLSSYDGVNSNREDLTDLIYNIDPTDTPFMKMIAGRVPVTNTTHQWQIENLAAASTSNARIEGDDVTSYEQTVTSRASNVTQISDKKPAVTGTQEVIKKAGKDSEMARQVILKGKELARDMESILIANQASVAGDDSTARKLRSLESWYATNVSRGASGANGSTSAAATDGTQRALTETMLKDVLQLAWNNGGKPGYIMCGSFNKRVISGFAGNATRTMDATEQRLVTSVKVYESDWGSLTIVPNRFQRARTVHVLDSEMVKVGFLRGITEYDLAKTGDSMKKQILAEYTLEMCNEAAHGVIADLTTS